MAWGFVCMKYSVLSWEKTVEGKIRNTHKIIFENPGDLILIAGGVKFQVRNYPDKCIQEVIGIESEIFRNLKVAGS